MAAGCPRCKGVVALHEGRPSVSGGGVELWHRACWDARDTPLVTRPSLPEPVVIVAPRRGRARWVGAAVSVAALATAVVANRWADASPRGSLANVDIADVETVEVSAEIRSHDLAPPAPVEPTLEERFPVPELEGTPLDAIYTSLAGWTHPVTRSPELVPSRHSRTFGSHRAGVERAECGDGHCGVDLDGPRGRPLVAVADGTVVRVERKELGSDGRSGRYVRLQHDDGTLTAYMHLDDVAPDLQVGDHVRGGQYVGTLGATAVYSAPPHLHFSLEVPADPDARGDIRATRYVDPSPFLVRARIVETADRRRGEQPAS